MQISAIILAAGYSRRYGSKNKLKEKVGGKMLLQFIIDIISNTDVVEVNVVVQQKSDWLKIKLPAKAKFIENSNASAGLTSSICAGIERTTKHANAFMICLADMPLINMEDYQKIINNYKLHYKTNSKLIQIPFFEEKRGHPVVFSSAYKEEILNCKASNGCYSVIINNGNNVISVIMDTDHVLLDLDEESDYKMILSQLKL